MGTPAEKLPTPDEWTPEQAAKASAIIDAVDKGAPFKGSPERLAALRQAREYYDLTLEDGDTLDGIEDFAQWRAINNRPGAGKPANDNAQATAPTPAPAAAPSAAPAEPQSMWSHLAAAGEIAGNKMRGFFGDPAVRPPWVEESEDEAARQTGRDAMRGAGQGFTFGFGDELSALASSVAPDPWAGQRAKGRGFDAPLMTPTEELSARYTNDVTSERRANAEAQERSPWAYGAGQVAGTLPATIATAPLFGTAGEVAKKVPWKVLAGRNAAQGAAMGAVAGTGAGEEGTRLSDAAVGAGTGAAGGVLGTGLAYGASKGLDAAKRGVNAAVNAAKTSRPGKAIADFAAEQAPRFRLASVGPYGSQIKKLAENEGFDYTERELGNAIEAAYPAEEGVLGLPKLRSPRDFAKVARPRMEQSGQDIDAALAAMDEQGVSAPVRPTGYGDEIAVVDAIDDQLKQYGNAMRIGDDDKVMRAALRAKRMQALEAAGEAERLRPTQLAAMKRSLEGSGYQSKATAGLPVGVRREANRIASAGPRNALRDAAEKQALPETVEGWNRANKDYALHKTVAELAEGRTAQEQGNQIASLPSAVGTVASGGVGLPVAAAWEGAKRYGADAVAHGMYGTARAMTPRAAQPIAEATEEAIRAGATRPAVSWGALAARGQPLAAQDSGVHIGEAVITRRETAERSKGHELQGRVRDALRTNPAALGPFSEQLRAVENDPVALGATIGDLSKDERWRTQVLPALTGGTP